MISFKEWLEKRIAKNEMTTSGGGTSTGDIAGFSRPLLQDTKKTAMIRRVKKLKY
jgi:hypothetical protein